MIILEYNNMKKLITYISKSKFDLIMVMISLSMSFRLFHINELASAILLFYAVYIFVFIIHIGQIIDLLNDYVYDKKVRRELNLHSVPGEIYQRKNSLLEKIGGVLFWFVLITILVLFAIRVI